MILNLVDIEIVEMINEILKLNVINNKLKLLFTIIKKRCIYIKIIFKNYGQFL